MENKEKECFDSYFENLKKAYETIDDLAVLGKDEPVKLENLYVPIKLNPITGGGPTLPGEPARVSRATALIPGGQDYAPGAGEQKKKGLTIDTALKRHRHVIVTGPPGSGKTTLLRYLTYKMCRQARPREAVYRLPTRVGPLATWWPHRLPTRVGWGTPNDHREAEESSHENEISTNRAERSERDNIPVHVILRDFIKGRKDLRGHLNEIVERYGCRKAKKPLESALKQGRVFLFLDGLDEILDPRKRERVFQDIHEMIKKYNRCRVLLTTRDMASGETPEDFSQLEMPGFDRTGIKTFTRNWFGSANPDKIDSMLDLLANNKDIEELTANPLFISLTATLHEKSGDAVLKRAHLYKRLIALLLHDWDAHKNIGNRFALPVKKHILKKIATGNHTRQRRTMTAREILDDIEKQSVRTGFEIKNPGLLLEEICRRSYLLRQLFKGIYDFPNIFFRHYFTALELIDREDGPGAISPHFSEPHWEEPILLYAGIKKDATSLITVIRQKKPEDIFYSNLLLAGKCIAEADYTDPFLEEEITRGIRQLIDSSDFRMLKERAIAVLARLKPLPIIDELMNKLTDKESPVRQFAAETLGRIGSAAVLPALMMTLARDPESTVRSCAAAALGRTGGSAAIRSLVHVLHNDSHGEVRVSAAGALGSTGSSEALPALLKTLDLDHDTNVRGAAAEAVGEIGSMEPVPQLVHILSGEKESAVRWRTAMALGKLQGNGARDLFIEALDNDKDKEVRESAAEGLGIIGSAECITALIKALSFDIDAGVRGSAAYALGLIRSGDALPALIKALITDPDIEVRGRAAFALGQIKAREAIPYLVAVFNTHKESIIRGNATYALGETGGADAIPFLIQALTLDKDSYVRFRAAEVLGSIGSVITIQPLKTALEDEGSYYGWKVKDKAYESLEKISKRCHVRITWTGSVGE